MKRKDFLHSGALAAAGLSLPLTGTAAALGQSKGNDEDPEGETASLLIPPYLKAGDIIAIASPAGTIALKDTGPCVAKLTEWGYKVKIGSSIGKKYLSLGGTDEERLADLQYQLDDPSVKAILCARGGYGCVRIVERLNWTKFKQHPKWIIGFSDITVLHSHLNRRVGVASIHSKMCGAFPEDWSKGEEVQRQSAISIRQAFSGASMTYPLTTHPRNRLGTARGQLVGGNLKTIESLAASSSDIQTAGKILFVEDVGEYLYSIDRMFWNLQQTGKLAKLAGLIIGGFRVKPSEDPEDEFPKDLYDIVWEKIAAYKYPVMFDFPVGHQKNNFALKCGLRHQLNVQTDHVSLTEII